MKAPSSILKNLSFRRIQPKAPAAVAPSPVPSQFDRVLANELDTLELSLANSASGEIGLVHFLDAAIITQKIALDSLLKNNSNFKDGEDRVAAEDYLDSNIEILDSCNHHAEKLGFMKNYVDSLKIVAHLIEVGSGRLNCAAMARALEHLDSCHGLEKRLKAMEKHGSSLRRVLKKRLTCNHERMLNEVLCGSMAMALMGCKFLGLSFDSPKLRSMPLNLMKKKKSQPTKSSFSWLRFLQEFDKMGKYAYGCLMVNELVNASKELNELLKGKKGNEVLVESCVERIKRRCNELEDLIEVIEGRVNVLYKSLIDVRMALMGILSH